MELPNNISHFHGSRRTRYGHTWQQERPSRRLKTSKSVPALSDAATHFGHDPIGVFSTVTAQALRFQIDTLNSAGYFARHPTEAVGIVANGVRHPFDTYQTLANCIFGPTVAGNDSSVVTGRKLSDGGFNNANERLARCTRLLEELRTATSWADYEASARELGELEDDEDWKNQELSALYDVERVKKRLHDLEKVYEYDNLPGMLHLIRTQLTRDLGCMSNPALFDQTRFGTKALIEQYTKTVEEVLQRIVTTCGRDDKRLDKATVEAALKHVRQSYGRTALLFSGGGTLGMIHIGVIKAFWEAGALPRIISGSSAGAIVCAVLCTKTDAEIPKVLHDFCHGDLAVFVGADEKRGWYARLRYLVKNGNLFNVENLERVMRDLLGDMTFLEAYNQTRRILNITVSSAERYESRQVLNYSTAGDVCIWSAVVASCSLPFGYRPGQLISKDPRTKLTEPWDAFTLHVDGSVEGDLPINKVSAEFNVNHIIASQVNPHVVPFLENSTKFEGLTRRIGTIASSIAKDEGMHRMENLAELPCLANLMTKASSVLGQQYTGDITVLPEDTIGYFVSVLSNPTPDFMEQAKRNGEQATWPKLSMIKNRLEIELLIDKAVDKMKEHVSFSDSASDLRRMLLENKGRSSRSAGATARPGSSGSHQTARSTIVPRSVQDHRSDHRSVKSMVDNSTGLFDNPGAKVAGDLVSPTSSSSSRSASFSFGSSDDSGGEGDESNTSPSPPLCLPDPLPGPKLFQSASQPNSPNPVSKGFFDTPRSGSPAPLPVHLMMTPSSQRPSSPELKYRHRFPGSARLMSSGKSPPRTQRAASRERAGTPRSMNNMFGLRADIPRVAKKIRRKRSSSTGEAPEPREQ